MGCGGSIACVNRTAVVPSQDAYHYRVLLTGSGESGKSAFLKQLESLGPKEPRLEDPRETEFVIDKLHANIVQCVQSLLVACEQFSLKFTPAEQQIATWAMSLHMLDNFPLRALPVEDNFDLKSISSFVRRPSNDTAAHISYGRLSPEEGKALLRLINSQAMTTALLRRREFWLLDQCDYYFKHLERISAFDFTPTWTDVLAARVRSSGIVEINRQLPIVNRHEGEPSHLDVQFIDVGGERHERFKWSKDNTVNAVFFFINLAGFQQRLYERQDRIRMLEDLDLLSKQSAVWSARHIPLFVVFNKKDMFMESDRRALRTVFPDMEVQCASSFADSLNYVVSRFVRLLPGTVERSLVPNTTSVAPEARGNSHRPLSPARDSQLQPSCSQSQLSSSRSQSQTAPCWGVSRPRPVLSPSTSPASSTKHSSPSRSRSARDKELAELRECVCTTVPFYVISALDRREVDATLTQMTAQLVQFARAKAFCRSRSPAVPSPPLMPLAPPLQITIHHVSSSSLSSLLLSSGTPLPRYSTTPSNGPVRVGSNQSGGSTLNANQLTAPNMVTTPDRGRSPAALLTPAKLNGTAAIIVTSDTGRVLKRHGSLAGISELPGYTGLKQTGHPDSEHAGHTTTTGHTGSTVPAGHTSERAELTEHTGARNCVTIIESIAPTLDMQATLRDAHVNTNTVATVP